MKNLCGRSLLVLFGNNAGINASIPLLNNYGCLSFQEATKHAVINGNELLNNGLDPYYLQLSSREQLTSQGEISQPGNPKGCLINSFLLILKIIIK